MEKKQNAKEKKNFYEHKPYREFKASLSEDGKYWIFRDVTIHVVPREYLRKVENSVSEDGGDGDVNRDQKMDGRNA